MSDRETLKIMTGTDNVIEFMYDTPKTGNNSYGAWYLYGINHDGAEKGLFATQTLHDKLRHYGKGDKVNVRKEEYSPGKFAWNVIPEEGTSVRSESNGKSVDVSTDARTHDIHKQVCLKLACEMYGTKEGTLTDGDLIVIESNMKNLLMVLEGGLKQEEKDDFPF